MHSKHLAIIWAVAMSATVGCLHALHAEPKPPPPEPDPPVVEAPKAAGPIAVDGVLHEPVWARATPLRGSNK